jgi:hypothetical protein
LSDAIAEKVLLRLLTEIDALLALAELDADGELEAGAELLLELLELLQPAARSSAAATPAAVRPARADTEYNGVPRSFTQTCRGRHVRDQIRITRSPIDRATCGNARSAQRNCPVNTFAKPLKKR